MKLILKRLGLLLLTLLIISLVVFLAFQIIPGDPTVKMLSIDEWTPEKAEALRAELGLDKPIMQRYFLWVVGMFTGNPGRSYGYNLSVSELLAGKVSVTFALSAIAFALMAGISIPLGMLLARNPGGLVDRVVRVINQITMSIPPFFVGIIFTYVFGLILKIFTPGVFIPFRENPVQCMIYLFFAALAIALPKAAMALRLFNGSIGAESDREYVRTAYSRGSSRRMAIKNHVFKNAIMPVITFLALALGDIVAGSVIVEQIFAIPGLGRLLLLSISNRDFPVVQMIVVIIASVIVTANFAADALNRAIDPRMRAG